MICPRCGAGEIPPETNECVLCGHSPLVGMAVATEAPLAVDEAARHDLGRLFDLDRRLGEGPLSVVYLARDKEREQVALKVVPRVGWKATVPEDVFQRGLTVVTALDHPHIVPVLRFGVTPGFFWYAMRYVEGRSLAELLRSGAPLTLDQGLQLIEQVASALHYAHRRGIIHGDLKPANVIVDVHGQVLVADFQVAAILERLGARGPNGGGAQRVEYVAPEDSVGSAPKASADQYALAVLAYECLSGAPPFTGGTAAEVVRRQRTEAPPWLSDVRPEVPAPVSLALQRALSKTPAERFPSVLGFVSVMEVAREARAAPSSGVGPRSSPGGMILVDEQQSPPPSRRRYLGAGALIVIAVVAGAMWILWSNSAVEPAPLAVVQPPETLPPTPRVDAAPPAADFGASGAGAPREHAAAPAPTAASRAVAPGEHPAKRALTASAPGPAPGRLSISATPWGQLSIDDSVIGNTPKVGVPIAAGTHRLRIVRDGFEPFEQTIEVPPGREVRLTGLVLRELKP